MAVGQTLCPPFVTDSTLASTTGDTLRAHIKALTLSQASLSAANDMATWMAELDIEDEAILGCLLYRLIDKKSLESDRFDDETLKPAKRFAEQLFKLGQLETKSTQDRWTGAQAETVRRMLLAVVSDPRLVVARVAEQWVALNAAKSQDRASQIALAQTTRDVYAPLASRLGLHALKWELEDLAFRYLEPHEYHKIAHSLNEKRLYREQYLTELLDTLTELFAAQGIKATIHARAKHIYSIWRKMVKKNYSLAQIFDIRAVRILVDDLENCYRALSLVHAKYEPIAQEFDDYIQFPKANGYRSIHTAVLGPLQKVVEIQIRTHEMHEKAELGVAAHWRYKENSQASASLDAKVALLRQLLNPNTKTSFDQDALERASVTLFKDRIYVLSPKGDVIELPKGATGLDFAYQVHTQLGHRTRGVLIDGKMSSLNTILENGQTIEVITQKNPQPSRDWLLEAAGFLNTKSAKAKVRAWFRAHDYDTHLKDGRALLELAFNRKTLDITALDVAQALKYASVDELCVALGSSDLSKEKLQAAIQRLMIQEESSGSDSTAAAPPVINQNAQHLKGRGLSVMGVDDVLCHLARCCKPVKPEPILGYSTVGRGITLHRTQCRNLKALQAKNPERVFSVVWGNEAAGVYSAEFELTALDRSGLLRDVSVILTDAKCSIERMNTQTNSTRHLAELNFTVSVMDMSVLAVVLEKIRLLDGVLSVRRLGR